MKRVLVLALILITLLPIQVEAKLKTVTKETYEITYYDVTHHKGLQLVEKSVGVVLNRRKGDSRSIYDGTILNAGDVKYNYIAYKGNKFHVGDIVVTYLYYNPRNNAEDDVVKRVDKVIGHMTNKDLARIGGK